MKINVINKTVLYKNSTKEIEHGYDIKVVKSRNGSKTRYFLRYSDDGNIWTPEAKGKDIISCLDDGNCYKFTFHDNDYKFEGLEYDDGYHMYILLRYIMKANNSHKLKFK